MAYSQPSYGQAPPYGQPSYGHPQQPGGYGTQPGYNTQPGYFPPPVPGVDPKVAAWFSSIDTDRSGSLDAKELMRALAMGNLHYGLSDVDQMVRAFDTNGSRSLNLQEFAKLHEFLNGVTLSFNYFDTDRSRSLTQEEVVQALRHAGFAMDPPVVAAMFKRHDPDDTKTLSLDEYIRLTFGAFDSQKTGRITMDFNQFVYAASHTA